MSVRVEAFLGIESGLTDKLSLVWQRLAAQYRLQLTALLIRKDYAKAADLANSLDLTPIIEENKEYIRYSSYSALLFGASRLNENVKSTVVAAGGFDDIITAQTRLVEQGILGKAEDFLRDQLLTLIAEAQNADPRAPWSESDTSPFLIVTKFNPNHDEKGQFSSGGGGEKVVTYEQLRAKVTATPEYQKLEAASQAATKVLDEKRAFVLESKKAELRAWNARDPENPFSAEVIDNMALHLLYSDKEALKVEQATAGKAMNDAHNFVHDYMMANMPPDAPFMDQANQFNPQTELPAFKAWFGDSQVVGEDGKPLVVFHGSDADIKGFDTQISEPNTDFKTNPNWCGPLGTWFAGPSLYTGNYDPGNAESVAGDFARGNELEFTMASTGAVVYPVYLSIKKPKEFEGFEDFQDQRGEKGALVYRNKLIKQGYDGVVIRNSMTDGDADRDDWVAFYPEQIKSAIGNRGTFNPKSHNITKGGPGSGNRGHAGRPGEVGGSWGGHELTLLYQQLNDKRRAKEKSKGKDHARYVWESLTARKGGPGSGNFGHEGRPGEVGGSGAGGNFDPPPGNKKTYTEEMYKREGIEGLNYEQMVAKLGNERLTAAFDDVRVKERVWEAQMRLALSMGTINGEEARAKGFFMSGQGIEKIEPLPDVLYHVTTAVDAVMEHGLKTRDELDTGSGKGLGGGASDTISFATDKVVAGQIYDSMLLVHDVMNDKITMADLVNKATIGEDAKRPFIADISRQWAGPMSERALPLELEAALQGRKVESVGAFDKRIPRDGSINYSMPEEERWAATAKALGPEWSSMGQNVYARPATSSEQDEQKMKLAKYFLGTREIAGGPMDPLFFLNDTTAFKSIPKAQIQILQVKPKAKTYGHQVSALSEWRVWTGNVVDEIRVVSAKMELIWKYDENEARDDRGRWTSGGSVKDFSPKDQARMKALKVPPAWTDIKLNPDETAALQVIGHDAKGRSQYLYSAAHSEEAAAEKFSRLKDFHKQLPGIREKFIKDASGKPSETQQAAAVVYLIDQTGFRIGSDTDTKTSHHAFGASTLEGQHVKVDGNKVTFSFTGKKGVRINKTVTDEKLAGLITAANPQVKQPIFDSSDAKVRDYFHSVAGDDFQIKDFRTWHGTRIALKAVKGMKIPKTAKDYKKMRKEVAEKVSKFLGNTPAVALSAYINPAVFKSWGNPTIKSDYDVMSEFFDTHQYDVTYDWRQTPATALDPDDNPADEWAVDANEFVLVRKFEENYALVSVQLIAKYNPNHDTAGRFSWAEGLTSIGDETGDKAPAVGKSFIVFRVGANDGLENRNAGNANGVAIHLVRGQSDEGPINVGGTGTMITAYKVTVHQDFEKYSTFNLQGGGTGTKAVGRSVNRSEVTYSFPKGGAWTATPMGSVKVKDVEKHLSKKYQMDSFDDAGGTLGATAIRDVFIEQVIKAKKFNPNHDAQGRFSAGEELAPGDIDKRIVDYKPDRALADPSKTVPITSLLPNAEFVPYSKTPFFDAVNKMQGTPDPMAIPVQEYLDAREKLFDSLPVKSVPMDNLVLTQKMVNTDRVKEIVDDPKTGGSKPIFVVRYKYKTYILNGHHRVAADVMRGAKRIDAHVLILKRKYEELEPVEYLDEPNVHASFDEKVQDLIQRAEDSRVLDPFQTFTDSGDALMQMISSLHTSRLSAYGFTAEADVLGVEEYALSAQLDKRVCDVCALMHGRQFLVSDAREALDTILHVDDLDSLKTIQAWPDQDAQSVQDMADMTDEDIVDRNWMIPPFHPSCRCLLVHTGSVPRIKDMPSFLSSSQIAPEDYLSTLEGMREYGVSMTERDLAFWNAEIAAPLGDILAGLTGENSQDLLDAVAESADENGVLDSTSIGLSALAVYVGNKIELELDRAMFGSEDKFKSSFVFDTVNSRLLIDELDIDDFGVQKRVLEGAATVAERMSLGELELSSDTVDSVTMARAGFLPTQEDWDDIRKTLAAQLATMEGLTITQRDKVTQLLADDNPLSMRELALYKTNAGRSVGQDLLDGVVWNGTLDLGDNASMVLFDRATKFERAVNCKGNRMSYLSRSRDARFIALKGGAGSGNFGHEGRPGEIGGSGTGGSSGNTEGIPKYIDQRQFKKLSPDAQKEIVHQYQTAEKEKPAFDAKLTEIAEKVGGKAILPSLKGSERGVNKIISDYKGDAAQIKDILRATIEVDNPNLAQKAIDALTHVQGTYEAITNKGFRNLLDPSVDPVDGYRDAKINVKIGGIIAEIQVNVPSMLEAKKLVHDEYVQRSKIEQRMMREGRVVPTPREKARIDALNAKMKSVYDPVWKSLMNSRN